MNYPPNVNLKAIGVEETDLHEQAGLLNAGIDEEGDQQWFGSEKAWDMYEKLVKEMEEEKINPMPF